MEASFLIGLYGIIAFAAGYSMGRQSMAREAIDAIDRAKADVEEIVRVLAIRRDQ